jgi:hypothetical protein
VVETVVIFLWDQTAKEFYYPSASVHTASNFGTEFMKPALPLFPPPIVEDQHSTVLIRQPEACGGDQTLKVFFQYVRREKVVWYKR